MSTGIKTPEFASKEAKRAILEQRLLKTARQARPRPLSFAQERLWFLEQLQPGTALYTVPTLVGLTGKLNLAALEQSLNAIVARHESLRTRFGCVDEAPVQLVDARVLIKLRVVDLTSLREEDREESANRYVREEVNRPFDLGSETLLRASLLRLGPEHHLLLLTKHHLIVDEWSLRVFFRELGLHYQAAVVGRAADLPALPIQYGDYAAWQRDWLQGQTLERLLHYWKEQLSGEPPVPELPTTRLRKSEPDFSGAEQVRSLGQTLTEGLQTLAGAEQATLFMVLLAGFKALLHRYSQQDDILVASPIAGRTRLETEGLIGFFVNTLPLRSSAAGDPIFSQFLQRVRQTTLAAYAHQELPFGKMVEHLRPERSPGHLPFSRVMFVLQNKSSEELQFPELKLEFLNVRTETSKFDLTLVMQETSRGLLARAEYGTGLFEPQTIERLLQHYQSLLTGLVAEPGQRLSRFPLLAEAERHQLLVEWNTTTSEYPREQCIHELFAAQAAQTPDAVAVVYGDQTMTYGELDSRANQLARYLRKCKVGPDVPVAIAVERSCDLVLGWLGILKAGGAYVPLDPNYPKERLSFMLRDTEAPVLITQRALLPTLPTSGSRVLCLDTDWKLVDRERREALGRASDPENLAYIIYTSGSTGQPKGVAVPHRAVLRLVLNTNYVQLDATERIAQLSNASFDAATFEVWGALLNGGRLVGVGQEVLLSPQLLAQELRQQKITTLFLTAALFNQLAAEVPGGLATVRNVLVGGEALEPKWVRAVLEHQPPHRLLNAYGPTENTTFTCCGLVRELASDATNVPVGRPISNTRVYILDAHLNPVPIGVSGELYASGDGVARGYWNRAALTAEKFIPDPFREAGSTKLLYATGDRARYLPDGRIELLGRRDEQVKIRGFRVELGEIEAVLAQHPAVKGCVVTCDRNDAGDQRLVCHWVASGPKTSNPSQLRNYLSERLPEFMVPTAFVPLAQMPLTPNGKVDRKSLPMPERSRPELETKYIPARNDEEAKLISIWENVLTVRPIGVGDRFFDLGGHSLLAVRLVAQIEKVFGKKLRLATIFQTPTIAQLAALLREETPAAPATSLVEIQGKGSRPPLFLVHGAGGGMFWGYANLSRHLGAEQPVYGFKSRGLEGREELASLEAMAAEYLKDLRTFQPHGPYFLGGYCFGGIVAYEMARQLAAQNEDIGLLALFNCAPPNSRYGRIPWTPRWGLRLARNLFYWAKYVCSWTRSQRREFVRWKWKLLKKRLGAAGSDPNLALVEAGDLVDLSSYTAEQRRVWEAHIRALVSFRPGAYRGRLHLFRSPGHALWCSFDPDYGWSDLAKGGVRVTVVPGAHEKILEEPCVGALSGKLADALNQAQSSQVGIGQCEPGRSDPTGLLQPGTRHAGSDLAQPEADSEYWKHRLAGAPEGLDLPADHLKSGQSDRVHARVPVSLSPQVARAVEALSAQQGCSMFVTLLAGLAAVLHRYTGAKDLVIGTLAPQGASVRSESHSSNQAGVIPLRCDLAEDPSFIDLMAQLRRTTAEDLKHRWLPSTAPAGGQPNASPGCVFETMLVLEEQSPLPLEVTRLRHGPAECDLDIASPALNLRLARTPDGTSGWLEYDTDMFEPGRMARFIEHWLTLLKGATVQPERRVSTLPLLPTAEAEQVLAGWNRTEQPYPKDKTVAQLFLDQVLRTPDSPALVSGSTRWTYGELFGRAATICERLCEAGVGRESLVGICLERTADMVAALLGTLMAGGAYVPLDPAYPSERLAFVLEDSQVSVLLTQRSLTNRLPPSRAQVVLLEEIPAVVQGSPEPSMLSCQRPDNLAYVIYTSGSTGRPKGVAIEHRSVVAFIFWAKSVFTMEELSGVLAATSICFDLSIFEIFVPLCSGGKVLLSDNALALLHLPAAKEVKLINTVPSAIRELLRLGGIPDSVQVVNLAGEPLATSLVTQLYRETRVKKVYDLYGPTETTTYSTFTLRQPDAPATIGRPLANEQVYLLDSHLQPVPIGIQGELYIGGDGLARGYLNRPDLTAERFVIHPFRPGARLYRTGDSARWREDGNLEYLGRLDHQVKIRGYRVELGEIESVLRSHPAVGEAAVLAREITAGERRLVAYVGCPTAQRPSVQDLRRVLEAKLPSYMVPAAFVFLDALPLTPNGKIDRKALPAPPEDARSSDSELMAARTSVEGRLSDIWRDVLSLKQISIRDNFFELGGHSLLATRIISRMREVFNVDVPLAGFFESPTIESLAQGLAAGLWTGPGAMAAPVPARVARTQAMPASFVQERLWFLDQLQPGSHVNNVPLALRLKGPLDVGALDRALAQVVQRHEALRTTFEYAEGKLRQRVAAELNLPMETHDLSAVHSDSREAQARDWLTAVARRPFDLARGPLARVGLVRLGGTEHILVSVFHHAISDGWSLALFSQDLQACYDVEVASLSAPAVPPLPLQYVDFTCWQREHLQGELLRRETDFWKQQLVTAPPTVALPADFEPAELGDGEAALRTVRMEESLERATAEIALQTGCTPFVVLTAALLLTLRKWTEQDDLVIGTVVAGRTRREFEMVFGCFMNFLPLRVKVGDLPTGRALLAKVREVALEAQAHQEFPFEKMVETVNPKRRLNQNPLYNVALLVQNFPVDLFQSRTLRAERFPLATQAGVLDLRFEVERMDGGLFLTCEYRSELFSEHTIELLLASYLDVLGALCRRPETPVAEFNVAKALQEQARNIRSRREGQNFAVAATFTAEPIAEPLQFWLDELGVAASMEFAPYNQVFQQLLDPGSLLNRNKRGLNLLLLRLEDWIPNEPHAGLGRASAARDHLARNAREFMDALVQAAARGPTPYLVCLCPLSAAAGSDPALADELRRQQEALADSLLQRAGIHVLTPEELARWYPVKDYDDPTSAELGQVPYTPLFFTALATAVARKFHALSQPACKVIAVDCDQTLWSGVCGEDGPQGVRLDPVRKALQEFLLRQRAAGKLLCLCSKNNEQDVEKVFSQRADLPLRREHFTAARVNWLPKSENLRSLAHELNLGLESIVFLDDNPLECAEVEANCPGVLALQLPENPDLIPAFLDHSWVFDQPKLTDEDRHRPELYWQEQERRRLRASSPSLDDFVAGLELRVDLEPMKVEQIERVAQLTQRTNQFNATTRRRTEAELVRLAQSADIWTVCVRDRFGDYGLVGVTIFNLAGRALEVDSFLLSCRVLGRGVEHRMLARLGELARQRGADWVAVHFVPTAKNQPALDFLESVGGSFKQALNGGYVFRFPSGFAAEVAFGAPAAVAEPMIQATSRPSDVPVPAGIPSRRFVECRTIALEANDAETIHLKIRSRKKSRKSAHPGPVGSRSELERRLCALWQELLCLEQVGVQEDFFQLGGTSLLAVRLFADIEKMTDKKFPLVTLFQAPTIEKLATMLAVGPGSASHPLLVPIRPEGSKPVLFLVHGAGGDVLWGYANLAAYLADDQPIYGIKSRGQAGLAEAETLESMAACYLEAIRARQPRGPYFLGGYCFGGNVAYEMARQLRVQGEQVALVALIDSAPSNAGYENMPWWRPSFVWRFMRNLGEWLKDFSQLKLWEQRAFFARKLRALGRKIRRKFLRQSGAPLVDVEEVIDPRHLPAHEIKLWQLHLDAFVRHVERPYPGPVTLLRTRGQPLFCSLAQDFCWSRLARGGVTVRQIPGSHENIFLEPHVQALARQLASALSQAQTGSALNQLVIPQTRNQ